MSKKQYAKPKGFNIRAFLCRVIGILMLLLFVSLMVSVNIPRISGIQTYNIISGSMEPEIPVGSVVYINPGIKPETVKKDEVIAFIKGDDVVIHRVSENRTVEGYFNTKGDANDDEDFNEVWYDKYKGKMIFHLPYIGQYIMVLTSIPGKISVICFAVCGILLNILAGRISRQG